MAGEGRLFPNNGRHWWNPERVIDAYADEGASPDDARVRMTADNVAREFRRMHWREEKRERRIRRYDVSCTLLRTEHDLAALLGVQSKERRRRAWIDEEAARRNGPVILVYSRDQAGENPPPADIEARYGKTRVSTPVPNWTSTRREDAPITRKTG
jgi:hypothetical protein